MMERYETCPACKAEAVHLATASVHTFYGDQEDKQGDDSIYADEEPQSDGDETMVSLFAHICFECGHLVDVGIEYPRDKVVSEPGEAEIAPEAKL